MRISKLRGLMAIHGQPEAVRTDCFEPRLHSELDFYISTFKNHLSRCNCFGGLAGRWNFIMWSNNCQKCTDCWRAVTSAGALHSTTRTFSARLLCLFIEKISIFFFYIELKLPTTRAVKSTQRVSATRFINVSFKLLTTTARAVRVYWSMAICSSSPYMPALRCYSSTFEYCYVFEFASCEIKW